VLVVTVTVSGTPSPVTSLDVTLTGSAGAAERQYGGGGPLVFPTTFTAQLPSSVTGELMMAVKAIGPDGATVAQGRSLKIDLRPSERQNVVVQLDCMGARCTAGETDGGAGPGRDGGTTVNPSCGNGRIDSDETCDPAIGAGFPGACPRDCDDGVTCTTDARVELRPQDPCSAVCTHEEIKKPDPRDRCCPAGATTADDSDCPTSCGNGVVDVGETCDTAIAAGAPGACPRASGPASCDDRDPCTTDLLVAAGTCSAVCVHTPVTEQSHGARDLCCPVGAWHEVDIDCPSSCGDGVVQATEGENCDVGIASDAPGGCPSTCEEDPPKPCTLDVRVGNACAARCTHTEITALVSGDGCCPTGGSWRTDHDCAQTCGNGVVEPGEACDKSSKPDHGCPTSCSPSPSACLENKLVGSATDCTARCELQRVEVCRRVSDGCCADGCTAANDPDCSFTCGDGVVQAANGETCDTAIAAGSPGACPKTCSDGVACTRDVLVAASTCTATCLFLPIIEFRAGDGCCPPGGDATVDPDCAPVCGNAIVEPPAETCDYAAGTSACPAACPAGDACTRVRLEGNAGTCSAACVAHPITTCVSGDGCCPSRCTVADDADCPAVCGDGVKSAGEVCDRAVTAGLPGACPRTCDDGDACTLDAASGTIAGCSRACSHTPVTACVGGDGCCPPGCNAAADRDCAPNCGDGRLGAGETCDPPGTCPILCPDDGDPCTLDVLTGDSLHCDVVCRHLPVTACSGTAADLCCPTGCGPDKDVDCPAWGPR
jgi:hypothetical protein